MSRPSSGVLGWILAAAVVAAVATGIVLTGSPGDARAQHRDTRRAQNLEGIAASIDAFYAPRKRLPESLDELAREPGADISVRDPVTDQPYEYRVSGGLTYELCATFERGVSGSSRPARAEFWWHGAGRHCFARQVQVR